MPDLELCYTPATDLARAIRSKALSPVELLKNTFARIHQLNPKLNAFCLLLEEEALAQAALAEQAVMRGEAVGPLHGIPVSIKDMVPVKGVRTMRGSAIFEQDVPDFDPPMVSRLRTAGAVLLGKTCTPEFGWKGVTDSPVTGITRNPWNTSLTPGGSTGGGAAQVAAGMGPLAQGGDGGGSIRIPAAFCGLFGIKPSFGRVPSYPAAPLDAMAHQGPLTRTVADAALMLATMAGPHAMDRLSLEAPPADYVGRLHEGIAGLRVAWSPDLGYARVDPEVAGLSVQAAKVFTELGCQVEELTEHFGDPTETLRTYWLASFAGALGEYLPEWEDRMDPGLVQVVKEGLAMKAVDYVRAQMARHQFWDRVRAFFDRYDLLLTPTLAVPPFEVGRVCPESFEAQEMGWIRWTPFTYPFNFAQNPAATVPAGFTAAGSPVGLQIVGRRFADLTVLQASAAYERVRPWADHRPDC